MRFYLSDQSTPVNENHDLWKKPLPVARQGNPLPKDGAPGRDLTYGQYFSAVESFVRAGPEVFGNGNGPFPDNVSVFLEKHGAFYHPSRVTVGRECHVDEYVLNVAFSELGRQYLVDEYTTLKRLKDKYGYSFLPTVYACREIRVDTSRTVSMFMGEWFSAFHEFHVSAMDTDNARRIRVWDANDNRFFMSTGQKRSVYEQAAMILTACYDIQTFEQISAWHHAAGDFVVKLDEQGRPHVKLVTVRRYAPLLETAENTAEAVLNGLLLFLMNLSLHMRLDRRDGVNEICWMDDCIVGATLKGFFQGLTLQLKKQRIPDGFIAYYKSFLSEMELETVQALFMAIASRLPAGSADTPIIQSQLKRHIDTFYQTLRSST